MQAVLLIGIQASGKSTFYRERFVDSHVRINLDMLKTRHREKRLLDLCVETRQAFAVDNTNPTAEDRQRYLAPARKMGMRVVGYYFASAIEVCLQRNSNRPEGQRVPDLALKGTHAKLEVPTMSEGFDELYYVKSASGGGWEISDWNNEV